MSGRLLSPVLVEQFGLVIRRSVGFGPVRPSTRSGAKFHMGGATLDGIPQGFLASLGRGYLSDVSAAKTDRVA